MLRRTSNYKAPKNPGVRRKISSVPPETQTQINTLIWLKMRYPDIRKTAIKITNEGARSRYTNNLFLEMGMYPGASDLLIAWPTKKYHGLFLEVKPDGFKFVPSNQKHTDKQRHFIEEMKLNGYWGEIGVGFDECTHILECYIKELI